MIIDRKSMPPGLVTNGSDWACAAQAERYEKQSLADLDAAQKNGCGFWTIYWTFGDLGKCEMYKVFSQQITAPQSAFDRLAAKILIGTNQKKDLRILKSGDLRQKPRKDLGNQSA